MAGVPNSLEEWTYDAIVHLLDTHADEDARFDWKAGVPQGPLAEAFIKSAVGMANGLGGFFVFGVEDKRRHLGRRRLRGIAAATEVAKEVGELLRRADPAIPYEPRQPPIKIPRKPGSVLHVIEILSTSAPHSFHGVLYKRTPRGSDTMSTTEVRALFLRREERLLRVRALLVELAGVRDALHTVELVRNSGKRNLLLRRIDSRLLGQLHGDILPLVGKDLEISEQLSALRSFVEVFNLECERAASSLAVLPRGAWEEREATKGQVEDKLSMLVYEPRNLTEKLIKDVSALFGQDAPPFRSDEELVRRGW
jgi:schlafen family protein